MPNEKIKKLLDYFENSKFTREALLIRSILKKLATEEPEILGSVSEVFKGKGTIDDLWGEYYKEELGKENPTSEELFEYYKEKHGEEEAQALLVRDDQLQEQREFPLPERVDTKVGESIIKTEWLLNGKRHKVDGPAVVYAPHRLERWYLFGKRHRVGGPAVTFSDGSQLWYMNDKLHRTDGPAVMTRSWKKWYVEGFKHRIDGPAVEHSNGRKEWYLLGERMSETEWRRELGITRPPERRLIR